MNPQMLRSIQAQRGQALAIPGREIDLRGLGMAKAAPGADAAPPPAQAASADSGIPWWAWAALAAGVAYYLGRQR